ncbi:MAG TPA: MBL fold metallo-hydrolase [Planctomycetota bacterium]|nr:MBL fold metallo-hydrolase [Planctomycetota bacterium]
MADPDFILETFPVGPLQCNCSIVGDPATGEAVVIDPGDDAPEILTRLKKLGLRAVTLVHTHAHFDHVGAARAVSEKTGAGIRLHEKDLFLYENLDMQGRLFGFSFDPVLPLEGFLVDGATAGSGRSEVEVLHTPGHTPGSVCFRWRAGTREVVFTGDTLFKGSVGRTDLWGGDFEQLRTSIATRLYALSEDATVIPGHGPATTIGRERRGNAFVRG